MSSSRNSGADFAFTLTFISSEDWSKNHAVIRRAKKTCQVRKWI